MSLGGWKYSKRNGSILFLNIEISESVNIIKKHLWASDVSISYNPSDDSELCEPGAVMHPSTLRYNKLISIKNEFHILIQISILADIANDRAHIPLKRWMAVYRYQLKAGLWFPVHGLFQNIMSYLGIEIGQIAPNRIRIVVAFILLCKCFGVPTSLELLTKFFHIKPVKDGRGWHSFKKQNEARNLITKMPQSIHGWKGR